MVEEYESSNTRQLLWLCFICLIAWIPLLSIFWRLLRFNGINRLSPQNMKILSTFFKVSKSIRQFPFFLEIIIVIMSQCIWLTCNDLLFTQVQSLLDRCMEAYLQTSLVFHRANMLYIPLVEQWIESFSTIFCWVFSVSF